MEVDEPAGPRPEQPQQQQPQVLLLLKGHPATGKSALARRLANTLRWPVVDKDDARDCLEASLMPLASSGNGGGGNGPTSSGGGGGGGTPASPAPAPTSQIAPRVLNDLSYDIMFRVAASQLSCGLSVIVDCPLARRELYERAAALAGPSSAAVVVVECVPASEEAWREALDTRVANAALLEGPSAAAAPAGARGSARHKPRSWEALQQLVRAYGDASEWTPRAPPAGAGGEGLASPRAGASSSSPSAASAGAAQVPHYLSVRTLRRGNSGGNGNGNSSGAAAADAATRAAADEVVVWLRRRGLCSAAEGAAAAADEARGGAAATEAVEIPVQGVHMPAIAE